MRRTVLCLVLLGAFAAPAGAATGRPTFYLAVVPGQCVISGHGKTVSVVPCSDPRHSLEVYAVGHGGWGHGPMPSAYATQHAIARSVCLAAFQRREGRPLAATEGWYASWPDPGAEQQRYGDKIVCSYGHYPGQRALGSGRHIR